MSDKETEHPSQVILCALAECEGGSYSDGLVLSQLALPAQGKSQGKFKDLSADVHTGLQGQPGQGFMSKILQQELRDFTQPVDYCED